MIAIFIPKKFNQFVEIALFAIWKNQELIRIACEAPMPGTMAPEEGIQPMHAEVGRLVTRLCIPRGTVWLGFEILLEPIS